MGDFNDSDCRDDKWWFPHSRETTSCSVYWLGMNRSTYMRTKFSAAIKSLGPLLFDCNLEHPEFLKSIASHDRFYKSCLYGKTTLSDYYKFVNDWKDFVAGLFSIPIKPTRRNKVIEENN